LNGGKIVRHTASFEAAFSREISLLQNKGRRLERRPAVFPSHCYGCGGWPPCEEPPLLLEPCDAEPPEGADGREYDCPPDGREYDGYDALCEYDGYDALCEYDGYDALCGYVGYDALCAYDGYDDRDSDGYVLCAYDGYDERDSDW
jgi:hypothetical protein